MSNKEKSSLQNIKGLKPVKPEVFEKYKRRMSKEVIPKIVEVVEKRRLAASKSRYKQLKC